MAKVAQLDVKNSFLTTLEEGPSIGVLGLENILVVADRDAVLVANLADTQKVSRLVDKMKSLDLDVAVNHSRDFRPWGWFEIPASGDGYKVKRLSFIQTQAYRFKVINMS